MGPGNTIGHETEQLASKASRSLMAAMSDFYRMLEALEHKDLAEAEQRRTTARAGLEACAAEFDGVAQAASDYPLNTSGGHNYALELAELYHDLHGYDYRLPLSNQHLPAIVAREIRKVSVIVGDGSFTGTASDWRIFRDAIQAANRMLSIGLLTARVSALHGHSPPLT